MPIHHSTGETNIFSFLILFFVWQVASVFIFSSSSLFSGNIDAIIYFFDLAGTIQLIWTIKSIRNLYRGNYFNLYLVFFLFLYVFSYGQFLMWTFGAYYENQMTVSTHVRFIDKATVVRIQSLSLALLAIFHFGVLLTNRNYENKINSRFENPIEINWLKKLSLPALVISFAINFYYSIIGFQQAAIVGYSALFERDMPPIIKYLSYMFVPSLYLVLITRDYDKKMYFFLTFLFTLYALPLLITGDRGSWIYFLGPWLWLYIKFVNSEDIMVDPKTVKRKTIFASVFVGLLLFISSSFVSVRHDGYTTLAEDAFSTEDFYTPFVKPFFEMGQSARVLGILIQDNLDQTWQYGNTFVADILGMVYPTIKVLLGYPDMYVENWISTDYLYLENYGVGFSSFAEAYLNGGLYFSWFYILLLGIFIGKLIVIKDEDVKSFPIKTFIALSTATVLGPSVRATMDLWLREFFWGCLLIIIVSKFLSGTLFKK